MRSSLPSWRGDLGVVAGTLISVGLSRLMPESSWKLFGQVADRWVLEWGVGGFYALAVLGPLSWRRHFKFGRALAAGVLSVLAWHLAARYAAEAYPANSSQETSLPFLGRSVVAGFLGAAGIALAPLAGTPHWERFLGVTAAIGGLCGGQMALLCLWNFEVGFYLGMLGWQVAVTGSLLYATAGRPIDPLSWWAWPKLN